MMFDENERYSRAAIDLDNEIQNAVLPIILRYIKAGYRIREVAYVASSAIRDAELTELLGWREKSKEPPSNDFQGYL